MIDIPFLPSPFVAGCYAYLKVAGNRPQTGKRRRRRDGEGKGEGKSKSDVQSDGKT
jgi:hypothetical protein